MTAGEIFLGAAGEKISALIVLVLLLLMLTMSLRLLLTRRKKAYFSLTLSLLIAAAPYAAIVSLGGMPGADDGQPLRTAVYALQTISVIFLNTGLYQLYNPSKFKVKMLALAGAALAAALSAIQLESAARFMEGLSLTPSNSFYHIWHELYFYAVLLFCFRYVAPAVAQSGKYRLSLLILCAAHTAPLLAGRAPSEADIWLEAAGNWLPVAYFFIVFLFIFERVLELMQAVYHSSITDGLTGLYNRRYFLRRLSQWIAAGIPVGVIFADIDNFKQLNDTKGHQEGDEALRRVAKIALDIAEDTGFAARFGGEEIVLMVEGNRQKIAQTAERLRQRVEARAGVTVSAGWAAHRKGVTAEQLVKQADEAMYISKRSGKNRVTAYKSTMAGKSGTAGGRTVHRGAE